MQIPFNYQPREYQLPLFQAFDSGVKRAVCVWHRRSGKDKSALNLCAKMALQRVGGYFHLFPTARQARKAMWDGIDRDGFKYMDHFPPGVAVGKNETDMKVTLCNGSYYQLVGVDMGLDWLVGTNPVGLIFSEWAIMNPRAWDLLRPILRENDGWALFIYTPRGQNHGYKTYQVGLEEEDWFCSLLTVDQTRRADGSHIVSPADIEAERREGMVEEMIQQEYFCSFESAIPGAYFSVEMRRAEEDGRITQVPFEPALPVDTWWDLGVNDATAIWFTQSHGDEVRCINYYENSGEGLSFYAGVLSDLRHRHGYSYGHHTAPHDIEVREFTTGKSRRAAARSLGINFNVGKKVLAKEESIDAARRLLPKVWFDRVKCEKGIACLRSYHKEFDDKRQTFRVQPVHDWSSNGADAFMELAKNHRNYNQDNYQPMATSDYILFGG